MADTALQFPLTTGAVARLLGIRERRIQEAVRQGVIAPRVVGGRRLWDRDEVLRLAVHLGVDTPAVRNAIAVAASGSVLQDADTDEQGAAE